jgi:hypothetical protein
MLGTGRIAGADPGELGGDLIKRFPLDRANLGRGDTSGSARSPSQEKSICIAEPAFQCREAFAAWPGLHLTDNRRRVRAEDAQVNIGAIAAIPGRAGQRNALP